jgi:hypothetical protein
LDITLEAAIMHASLALFILVAKAYSVQVGLGLKQIIHVIHSFPLINISKPF